MRNIICLVAGHVEPADRRTDARCQRCSKCLHFFGPWQEIPWSWSLKRVKTGSGIDVAGTTRAHRCIHCGAVESA